METKFMITVLPHLDLVRIKLSGFFSAEDIGRFAREMELRYASLRCGPNQHLTLCDVTALNIQPKEIVAMFSEVASSQKFQSKRLAFATGNSLCRQQAQRAVNREGVAFYREVSEAQAWLRGTESKDHGGQASVFVPAAI